MPITDFDFLPGEWNIANRRLADLLDPDCTEWETFAATSTARALLGGGGNMDEFHCPEKGYEGMSLRLYLPEDDLWQIWWASSGRPGRLDPPVVGRFSNARTARFECDDVLEGIPLKVRFDWSGITDTSARWEQSFSFDGGDSWKSNWIMELTR